MAIEATDRQMEIVEFVRAHYVSTGAGVNFDDICRKFGVQKNAVTGYINALEKKGLLKTEKLASGRRKAGGIIPADAIPGSGNLSVNVVSQERENSRIGENYVVAICGEYVVFMLFHNGVILPGNDSSGLYPLAAAVKLADSFGIDNELPVVERIAAVAAKLAGNKIARIQKAAEMTERQAILTAPPVETAAPKKARKSKAAKTAGPAVLTE